MIKLMVVVDQKQLPYNHAAKDTNNIMKYRSCIYSDALNEDIAQYQQHQHG
jgi:hypothetical protein